MKHKALVRRLQISCLGLDHVDPLRLLVDDVIEALRENAMREVQRLGQEIEQEPVAYLVLFEGAGKLLEFKKGNYIHGAKVEHIPLYAKPQIEVGCAECGVNGGHALYCVACAEKFVGGYKDSGVPAVETGLEQVSPDTPPQQEPVGYWKEHAQGLQRDYDSLLADFQAQRTWVGLTDEEMTHTNHHMVEGAYQYSFKQGAKWAEAKLKEKNT